MKFSLVPLKLKMFFPAVTSIGRMAPLESKLPFAAVGNARRTGVGVDLPVLLGVSPGSRLASGSAVGDKGGVGFLVQSPSSAADVGGAGGMVVSFIIVASSGVCPANIWEEMSAAAAVG